MAKASEIARSRVTAADSNKWLAGIVGFIGAMTCAFVAVIFAPAQWGFLVLLGVGAAAVAVPSAIALWAMRGASAEFKTGWLALLAVALLAWVAGGGWLKRTTGMETALRQIAASERDANARMAAMDGGERPVADPAPAAPERGNAFAMAAFRFRQYEWRRVEHYRRYLAALDGTDWDAMSDPWRTGPASDHQAKEARFQAGFDALDTWYAAEVDNLKTLRTDLAALGLPAPLAQRFERKAAGDEHDLRVLGYSERRLLDRARQVTTVLDTVRWSRDTQAIRFRERADAQAYDAADPLLRQAAENRRFVRYQLHEMRAR